MTDRNIPGGNWNFRTDVQRRDLNVFKLPMLGEVYQQFLIVWAEKMRLLV